MNRNDLRDNLIGILFGLLFGMVGVAILDWWIRRNENGTE